MALFLVERYLPDGEDADLASRARSVADLVAGRADMTYHWCLLAVDDATVFCLFEAPDAGAVADLNRRSGFHFDRVTGVDGVIPPGGTIGGGDPTTMG